MSPVQCTYTTLPADSGRLLVLFTRTGLTFGLQRVEKNGIEKMAREEAQCTAREHCKCILPPFLHNTAGTRQQAQPIHREMYVTGNRKRTTNKGMRAVHYNLATLPHTVLPDVSTPAQKTNSLGIIQQTIRKTQHNKLTLSLSLSLSE